MTPLKHLHWLSLVLEKPGFASVVICCQSQKGGEGQKIRAAVHKASKHAALADFDRTIKDLKKGKIAPFNDQIKMLYPNINNTLELM